MVARTLVALCVVAMAATGCSLSSILPTAQACPAGLLEGTLARGPGGSAVVTWEFGDQAVRWPEGYAVEQEPELQLLDERGALVASEGDPIFIGGGFTAGDELFVACGYVSTEPP